MFVGKIMIIYDKKLSQRKYFEAASVHETSNSVQELQSLQKT